MQEPKLRLGVAVAALALTLGACSDSSAPAGSTDVLTQVQANDISADVSDDVDELAELSVYDASNGIPLAVRAPTAPLTTPPAACATLSPNPPTNSDGDAVPDSVRFDYSACVFTRAAGVVKDSLSGTIDFIDPAPSVAGIGVRHVFTDFTRARTNTAFPLRSYVAVHNGTRQWGGNADTLGHTITNFVSTWTHPSGRVTTHTKNWVATFTAATPGSISLLTPLPAGSFVLGGAGEWTTRNRTWSVVTTTIAPLDYDPACTTSPRFTGGQLNLVVTRNGEVTNVDIAFTGCGQYTVTRTPGAV